MIPDKNTYYHRLLGSRTWHTVRLRYLSKHPLCEMCEKQDITKLAQEVHHIKPLLTFPNYGEMRKAAYSESNLMALCQDCHHAVHEHKFLTKAETKQKAAAAVQDFIAAWLDPEQPGAGTGTAE